MFVPAIVIHGGAGSSEPKAAAGQRPGAIAALTAGWAALSAGASAVDAVCAAVSGLEDDPNFNAGFGSCLTSAGRVEMDASIMDGSDLRCGAVAVVRRCRNPIQLARAVMIDRRHVFYVGEDADAFAAEHGLPLVEPDSLIAGGQRERLQRQTASPEGTVGAVAVDRSGHVAAATSTGGMLGKRPGRVGDSAVIGAGTYADDRLGAASATGEGEAILRVVMSKAAVDGMGSGEDPQPNAQRAIDLLAQRTGGRGGIILVDRFGRIGAAFNAAHMTWGYRRAGMSEPLVWC